MKSSERILIKDPYLNSTFKAEPPQASSYLSVPKPEQGREYFDNSKWKIEQDMKRQLERTQNQFRRMARAYTQENKLNRKILDYQAVNGQYHEALKLRNLDLNNRLNDMVTNNHLLNTKFETDCVRNYHEKDLLLKKYEGQAEQLLQARKTINTLMQHKTKLQQQLQHMAFVLDRQSDRFNLEIKQQVLRMEGLERSIKNLGEVKDQQIGQLRNRIRIYQDENKRLNDQNRGLNVTITSLREKQNRGGIQNLSQIQHLDSNMKDPTIQKQLQDQKHINDKLQKQLQELKRKLFSTNEEKRQHKIPQNIEKQKNQTETESPEKVNGVINSINTLRNGINKQVFEVFYKSVKDGEKHRSNSLVIFIQNWKNIDLQRMNPYIKSYLQSRQNLKQICLSNKHKGKQIHKEMQECIPLHISIKKGRSQINTWILSTIQHTKNQRENSKKSMNNLLLFLFRLLTIYYRIHYPMQGKSYSIDGDVRNQLSHEIVKAVHYIIQFR